ncbi:MAG: hydantoin racemase [Gammaproteobacteria bacterium]|nr:hydantoin racemase [Gammaproteobacteria bacterium]
MNTVNKITVRWLNPLGLSHYDELMGQALSAIKNPTTTLEVVSLNNNLTLDNLEYRYYESLVVGDTVRAAKEADENKVDAMVIGCFYDLALEDCREICRDTIIVAPCQASMQIAASIANKFSVIVGQVKWIEQMKERAYHYGYRDHLASMRSIGISANALQCDPEYTVKKIIEQGRIAMEQDHAEALILGCTCNFGLYKKVQDELGIPVIDPLIAAFKTAEYLAELKVNHGLTVSNKWSSEPPPEEEVEKFKLNQLPTPIGNKLIYN